MQFEEVDRRRRGEGGWGGGGRSCYTSEVYLASPWGLRWNSASQGNCQCFLVGLVRSQTLSYKQSQLAEVLSSVCHSGKVIPLFLPGAPWSLGASFIMVFYCIHSVGNSLYVFLCISGFLCGTKVEVRYKLQQTACIFFMYLWKKTSLIRHQWFIMKDFNRWVGALGKCCCFLFHRF